MKIFKLSLGGGLQLWKNNKDQTSKAEQGHTRVPSKSFPYIPTRLKVWSLGHFPCILIS